MYRYLVLYLDSLSFKCFAGFNTLQEARKYLNTLSSQYTVIGIAEIVELNH